MIREVIDCDRCKKKESVLPSGRFRLAVGSSPDGAGSIDTDYETVDLCPDCIAKELASFLKAMNSDIDRYHWVKHIRGGKL